MNMKKLATLSLAAVGALAVNSSFANIVQTTFANVGDASGGTTVTSGQKCLSSALREAGYVLDEVKRAYNTYNNNELDTVSAVYGNYTLAGTDSRDHQGLVYWKFGKNTVGGGSIGVTATVAGTFDDSGIDTDTYVFVAYMGRSCGVYTDTKLFCSLYKDAAIWKSTTALPTTRSGFWMNCQVCDAVYTSSAGGNGYETTVTHTTKFRINETATRANLQKSGLINVAKYGVHLNDNVPAWGTGAACSATPDSQSSA